MRKKTSLKLQGNAGKEPSPKKRLPSATKGKAAPKKATSGALDYKALFESLPGLYLILTPDLTIAAASDAYLNATMTRREDIAGKYAFDVFPDNPDDSESRMKSAKASLLRVLKTRAPDTMPILKYDIRKPESEGGGFEERYWSPINSPCFNAKGELVYLIHRVEDITEFVKRSQKRKQENDSGTQIRQMEIDVFNRSQEVGEVNRKLYEKSVETQRLLAAIVESSQDAIISKTLDGIITSWNAGAEHLLGYKAKEAIGRHVNFVIPPELQEEERNILAGLREGRGIENHETRRTHKDGRSVPLSLTISPIFNDEGEVIGASKIARDIADRKEAEKAREQLQQAQKMESLGQLTGGIAHDFNNLLAVILGNLDFLNEKIGKDDPLRTFINPSIEAAEHGAELTGQLLAFGRKQSLQPKIVSVNEMLESFSPLVTRTLGERLKIVLSLTPDVWNITVDPVQLQNALLNLSVNARDAMPDGGKLILETSNTVLDEGYADESLDIPPGEYAVISVSDTGTGMSMEVIEKAFEPFFTTKEVGKGTGLGLSMVYGFVKQSKGHIKLYSEKGFGTTVKIFLPRAEGITATSAVKTEVAKQTPKTAKIILVVEDNKNVLKLTSAMVESLGYIVVQSGSGDTAMEIIAERDDITLLLTDVMLPGAINGPALAERALKLRPGLKVLFNSGYAEQAIFQTGLLQKGVHLLSKPFRKQQLAEKLAELIE